MSQSPSVTRRGFLRAGVLASAPLFVPARVLGRPGRIGANDRVLVGVIGVGVRGKYLIGNLPDAAKVVALCDCYRPHVDQALGALGPFEGVLAGFRDGDAKSCKVHRDYRRMLEEEPLDAAIIATPDHHHMGAALHAIRAGLDVYVEKPLTVAIAEGRVLVDAARRAGKVVQVGSQQRTMEVNRFACEFLRDGGLGKISLVEVANYPGPLRFEGIPDEPVPPGLDWDLFCGPAPLRPHNRKLWLKEEFTVGDLLWRGWDLWSDYSGHLMTNWGAHGLDMVQYALGKDDTGPVEVRPFDLPADELAGLARHWDEKTPTPGTIAGSSDMSRYHPVSMRYDDGTWLRFVTGGATTFYGERGRLTLGRNTFSTDPEGLAPGGPGLDVASKWDGPGHVARPHLANWLDCLRTRATPNAPPEVGQRSVTVCHLANLARELRRPLRWSPPTERFLDDDEANARLDRPRRPGFELPEIG